MDRPVGSMNVALFEKIVRELSLYRPALLKIGGHGEPATHPQFSELMALLPHKSVPTFVYTNGSLIQLFPHQEILSWKLQAIVISVDGLDADSYEKIKIGGNYTSLKKVIMEFHKCCKSLKSKAPIIEIRHVIMPNETTSQLLRFRRTWLKSADTVKFNYLEPAGGLCQFEDPSPPKCRSIKREITIHWDGSVPVCGVCRRDSVGNVQDSTILELWRHQKKDYLRQCNEHRDFDLIPLCKRCAHCR
jgi:radical SAM protein with 4Fe4S-binding SPASM domain